MSEIEKLQRIHQLVDEACFLAYGSPDFTHDLINWADLGCVEASFVVPDGGFTPFYRVRIEEADPGCNAFSAFVHDFLVKNGFSNVEVLTAW